MKYFPILFFVCLLSFFSLNADEPTFHSTEVVKNLFSQSSSAPASQGSSYWKDFVNMLVTLAFILALILGSVWFLKKLMRSRAHQLNRTTGIKILERRALNPKASLYLITILGKGVVISESQAGIQLITEFPQEANIELLFNQKNEESKSSSTFSQMLQKKMDLFRKTSNVKGNGND